MDLIPGRFRRERTNEPCQLNLALSLMTACTSVEASAVTNWSHSRSARPASRDRKSTRLNSSHSQISYAVFCLKKKNTEGDNFVFAYATNVAGNDPPTGTSTTMVWVNATSDQTYSFILPSSVAGKQVWILTKYMDHTVGNVNLDTVFVDQMYVRAATPSGTTGVNLAGPAPSLNLIDADDQHGDHFADLVAC